MQKLPPLNSLRYFLVAAQSSSFKDGADRLYVTQAAISQHIKTLESHLGRQLFVRGKRQVQLSEDGRRLLPDIQQGSDALVRGVTRLQEDPQPNVLNISMMQSFAFRWMVPKLSSFQAAYPDISVRLDPSNEVMAFDNSDLDLAIRFGLGEYAGLESRFLMADKFCLVCHPTLVSEDSLPEELAMLPMLEENSSDIRLAWQHFFKLQGLDGDQYTRVLRVEDSSHMIVEAALAGQGMAMLRYSLVYQQLQRKQLVKLFDYEYACEYGYYLVAPAHHFELPKIQQFEQWIKQEILEIQEIPSSSLVI
jgi:LysR family glycine cleavage system transcriptional activator